MVAHDRLLEPQIWQRDMASWMQCQSRQHVCNALFCGGIICCIKTPFFFCEPSGVCVVQLRSETGICSICSLWSFDPNVFLVGQPSVR